MAAKTLIIPTDARDVTLKLGDREVHLTNLPKLFWKELAITKRDLLQYYADVSPFLLPHLAGRAMVMKRYPNGAGGDFFYMKRAPEPRPNWIDICEIPHNAGLVNFPIVQDLPSLLWLINLGCIDLNPWYARCDDTDRPDFLHFDLDPGPGADFAMIRTVALHVRDILGQLGMPLFAKTSGSKGIHVYIPIVRGPLQKEVWTFAKAIAIELESRYPDVITAEYRKVNRPYGRVLVDYNQNAWGRTLASIYSVRPTAFAGVSTPVTWEEIEAGVRIDDFRIDNVRARLDEVGDLWKPVLGKKRFDLQSIFQAVPKKKAPAARKSPGQAAGKGVETETKKDSVIRKAIQRKRLIRFELAGHERVAEPHDYGIRKGVPTLLAYQVGGSSSSGKIPQWRWIELSKASKFAMLDETFAGGRRVPTSKHSTWDELFIRVQSAD